MQITEVLKDKFVTVLDIDNAFYARFSKRRLFLSAITQYEHSSNCEYETEEIVKIMEIARELSLSNIQINNEEILTRKQVACVLARGLFGFEQKIGLFAIILDFNTRAFTHLLTYFANVKKRPPGSKIAILNNNAPMPEIQPSDETINTSLVQTTLKSNLNSKLNRIEYLESLSYKNDFCLQFPECFMMPKLAPKSPVALIGLEQYSDERGAIDSEIAAKTEMSERAIIFAKLNDCENAYTDEFQKELCKIEKNLKLLKHADTPIIVYDRSKLNPTFRALLHIIAAVNTSTNIMYWCNEDLRKHINVFLKYADNEQLSMELLMSNYAKIIKEIKRDQLNNYNQINTKKINFIEWIMRVE